VIIREREVLNPKETMLEKASYLCDKHTKPNEEKRKALGRGELNEDKMKTLGKGVSQFGNCLPYCDKVKLRSLLPEFVKAYAHKPFPSNKCGCSANQCASNFLVAKLSGAKSIIENGVNAGMSGYLFRAAQPKAEIWHVDPLAKPICDPNERRRWKDPGLTHYFVGPSTSVYYAQMAAQFSKSDGADATSVAQEFNSHGFQDFFEIDWANSTVDKSSGLVFFDTHQRDFDNILKAVSLGFKTFLVDDNYHANEIGDMGGHSVKQVFHRADGQAKNLASILDFYYELPPLINPFLMGSDFRKTYPALYAYEDATGGFTFNQNSHNLGFYQEPLLNLSIAADVKLFEYLVSFIDVSELAWYNHMAVLGVE